MTHSRRAASALPAALLPMLLLVGVLVTAGQQPAADQGRVLQIIVTEPAR